MNALRSGPTAHRFVIHTAPLLALEPEAGWSAPDREELVPPDTLTEARARRDDLVRLLRRERETAADFLLALADFDRRCGWEPLGHSGLFPFLVLELGLSKGGAFFRLTAARLITRHPEVLPPLRDGRLCITSVVELARVATAENLAEVLPRFFGCSSREAKEVVADLLPRSDPPRRAVVTPLPAIARAIGQPLAPGESFASPQALPPQQLLSPPPQPMQPQARAPTEAAPQLEPAPDAGTQVQSTELLPRRAAPPLRAEVVPLTGDLRRLHVTVSARLLEKITAARDGLSHALPRATTEEVLEAALDLLLFEKQARSRAVVKRPRAGRTDSAVWRASAEAGPSPSSRGARHVPAALEREVRLRDGDRCQFPLDGGGRCGSSYQVELDHLRPLALGGATTAANLRCLCRTHNRLAARQALGPVAAGLRGRRRR